MLQMNPVEKIIGIHGSPKYYECRFCEREFDSLKERDQHEKFCEWTEK